MISGSDFWLLLFMYEFNKIFFVRPPIVRPHDFIVGPIGDFQFRVPFCGSGRPTNKLVKANKMLISNFRFIRVAE